MRCPLYEAGRCRSCGSIELPYHEQLARKQAGAEAALGAGVHWQAPVSSAEQGFRNKAKLVVAGKPHRVTLGILDERGRGIDLTECPLYPAALARAFEPLRTFLNDSGVEPYDVPGRRGELKHVIVTVAEPEGALMLRFVLRSRAWLERLDKELPRLLAALPRVSLVSVNLQPEHKAILEGDEEVVIHGGPALRIAVGDAVLELPPKSFFQTNTAVAAALYREAVQWVEEVSPRCILDLFCGVGGFALHLAAPERDVVGVELSAEAVSGAERSRAALGLAGVDFRVGDALEYLSSSSVPADLIVVNPPRRGLGSELSACLDVAGARHILYSSCNVATLAKDLAAMPHYAPQRARVFDMFPHTEHFELLVLLERARGSWNERSESKDPKNAPTQIDSDPSRNLLGARCTLMHTGVPLLATRLASSRVSSTLAGSSSNRPLPP